MNRIGLFLVALMAVGALTVTAQPATPTQQAALSANVSHTPMESTDDWNRRIQELAHSAVVNVNHAPSARDYRIGPNDLLKIAVLEAPELSHSVRVSGDGDITMPLLGTIRVTGLTPRELELVLQVLLRRTYMKDPHVAVTVSEMQSHSVSVLGAVLKPGEFQIRGTKTVLEMLSMAGGLAPNAGDAVLVMRGAGGQSIGNESSPAQGAKLDEASLAGGGSKAAFSSAGTKDGETIRISLKRLLDTGDPKYNVAVYPGDIIKVKAAGIVYVVGDVKRPGGYPVQDNEHITVLQAIALGQGLEPTAAKKRATIIRVAENGKQIELPVPLNKILTGKSPDLPLEPKDVLFIPKSGAKSAGRSVLSMFSSWVVWHGVP